MITLWATVKWFLETFRMEAVVMVICVALGVGMVVTRAPQVWGLLTPPTPTVRSVPPAAVSPTVTPQPQAPISQATQVAQQCQTGFASYKQWAIQEGARSSAEKWRDVQQEFYTLVTYCNQHLADWKAPYQFVDLQQMSPRQTPGSVQMSACDEKMEEFRLWFTRFNAWAQANRPVDPSLWQQALYSVDAVTKFQAECKRTTPTWKAPYTATADKQEKLESLRKQSLDKRRP